VAAATFPCTYLYHDHVPFVPLSTPVFMYPIGQLSKVIAFLETKKRVFSLVLALGKKKLSFWRPRTRKRIRFLDQFRNVSHCPCRD